MELNEDQQDRIEELFYELIDEGADPHEILSHVRILVDAEQRS